MEKLNSSNGLTRRDYAVALATLILSLSMTVAAVMLNWLGVGPSALFSSLTIADMGGRELLSGSEVQALNVIFVSGFAVALLASAFRLKKA